MPVRHLSSREKRILIVCIAFVFIYINYNFVFKPLEERLNRLDQDIEIGEKRFKKNLGVISQEQIINQEYEKYSMPFKQKASDEKEMASILSEIESAANEINMRVADMKPKKVKRMGIFNNFLVSLTIDGELETITHFLYILQNAPHLFDVDEVRLEKSSIRTTQIKCYLVLSKALIPLP